MTKIIAVTRQNVFFFLGIIALMFLMAGSQSVFADENTSDNGNNENTKKKDVVLVNTFASVLDRDGHRENVTDIYDSFKSGSFYVCAGPMGQSPIYRIPKKDVICLELDGFSQNMSGWDYAACTVTLSNNKQQKGYIVAFHMGLQGYRTFQGKCDVGEYMISWKRLKKINFLGRWIEAPADKKKYKTEEYDEDKGR
jgi:hypothetical protein